MAATPIIQTDGSTSGPGPIPGRDREGLVSGETISITDTEAANAGASYVWTLLEAPYNAVVTLLGSLTPTPSLVLAAAGFEGSYKLRCEVDGTFIAEIIFSVPLVRTGGRIPSFGEQLEYSGPAGTNVQGWFEAMSVFMRAMDTAAPSSHPLAGSQHTPSLLAELNAKVSDATLIDTADSRLSDARTPTAHALGGVEHSADSLANLNAKITGGNLDFDSAPRTPTSHAASHLNAGGDTLAADVVKTTTGPTDMVVGAVADGEFLKRSGSTIVGDTPAGGGSSGPITAAQGAFIRASLSAVITDPVLNDAVVWDVEHDTGGSDRITYNNTNGQVTVKAGATALLMGQVHLVHTAAYLQEWGWYDVTGAAEVLGSRQENRSTTAGAHRSSTTISAATVRPLVDSVYELRLLNPSTAGVDVHNAGTWLQAIEIGAVQADVVGGLEFIDSIDVAVAVQSVSFGAAGDGVFQRALDGDVDEEYVLVSDIVAPATNEYYLRPNGVVPSASHQTRRVLGDGASASSDTKTEWFLGSVGSFDHVISHAEVLAKTGRSRTFTTRGGAFDIPLNTAPVFGFGQWDDVSTVIESLEIRSSAAAGIGVGSRFRLYRRTTANLRADSAAVYERHAMETVVPGALVTTERTTGHTSYGGSLVGVSLRVEDAVTAGDITVNVKLDGVTALIAVLDTTNSTSRVVRADIGVHKFSADKNISVEFVPTSYDNAGSVASPVTVQLHLTNDALITQNDRVVARTELTVNSTTLPITGLNGDLDEEYEIVGRLDLALGDLEVALGLNGAGTNVHCRRNVDNTIIDSTTGLLFNTGINTSQKEISFIGRFHVKRGNMRRSYTMQAMQFSDDAVGATYENTGAYVDETANLTSIDFICDLASGILAGSWVEVRRVKA